MRIKAERRDRFGKEVNKKMRREGYIPAVIYGQGKVYEHIKLKIKDVNQILREKKARFEIEVDGKVYDVVIKDVQIHPVTDQPIHFDFYRVEGSAVRNTS